MACSRGLLAQSGSVDSSFVPGTAANSNIFAIVPQPDGKILIGGDFTSYNGSNRARIARLNADGTLDTNFSPGTGASGRVSTIALQTNGQIVIGGTFTNYNGASAWRIARLNADGTVDGSFSAGTGPNSNVVAAALQPDGKVVIGGNFTTINTVNVRARIARLNTNGSVDTSFDTHVGATNTVSAIAVLTNDQILIAGAFTAYNGTSRSRIARLNADATLDTNFNKGTGPNSNILAMAVQPDGKVLIGGNFTNFSGNTSRRVARLDADGNFDTNSFNVGTGADLTVNAVAIQPDGRILIGGAFTNFNGTPRRGIARLNSDGSLDTTFDPGTGTAASNLVGAVNAIALQTDGKLLVGGAFTNFNGTTAGRIVRLNASSNEVFIINHPQSLLVTQSYTATFTVAAGGNSPAYQWRKDGGEIPGANSDTLIISNALPSDAGGYDVVVTNTINSVTSLVATLTVIGPPVISQQPAGLAIGPGDNAIFNVGVTGAPPYEFQWSHGTNPVAGATNASYAVINAQLSDAGDYSVAISNGFGATNSDPATLVVVQVPVITGQPQPVAALEGSNAQFSVTAIGSPPLSFQWSKGASPIDGATGPALFLSNLQAADAGTYSVTVSNSFGVTNSAGADLTIASPPVITAQPQSQTALSGTDVSFTLTLSGAMPFTFRWQFNNANIFDGSNYVGTATASLVITNVATNRAGNYRVIVSNSFGTVTSSNATLAIVAPPKILSQPTSKTVSIGGTNTFSVGVSGTTPLSYQWRFNGVDMPGRTSQTFTLTNIQSTDSGNYSVRVSNPYGTTNSAQALLTAVTIPTITSQPTNRTVATGASTSFSVLAAGSAPLRYQWFFNSSPLAGKTSSLLSITNVQSGNVGSYQVTVTNDFGATNSAVVTLSLLPPPVITSQPVGQTVEIGSNALFSVRASAIGSVGYRWTFNGLVLAGATSSNLVVTNVQIAKAGVYAATVTNSAGATNSLPASLTINLPALPFADNFADHVSTNSYSGLGSGSNTFATHETGEPDHGGSTGAHSVWLGWVAPASGAATITTAGSDFDTLLGIYTGTELTNLTAVASDDDGGGFLTSRAAFNAVGGEEYLIAVDGLNAAGNIILAWSLNTNITDIPQITAQPVSQIVPLSNSAVFSVTANAISPLGYQWYKNLSPMAGKTNPTLTLNNVQAAAAGYYRVRVSNTNGAVDSEPATLEVSVAAGNISRDKFNTLLTNAPGFAGFAAKFDSVGGPMISGSQILDNTGATTEPGERNHGGVTGGASRWTYIDSPGNGTMRVDTEGSLLDTALAVYTGTELTNLVLIAEDNDSGSDGFTSLVRFTATAGTRYLVAVDGVNGAQGEIHLNWSFGDAPTASFTLSNQLAAVGESIELQPDVAGSGPLGFQWLFNGSPLATATNPTLPLTALSSDAAGVYSLVVSNALGSLTKDVSVLSLMKLEYIGDLPRVQIAGPPGTSYQVTAADQLTADSTWNVLTNLVLPFNPYFILDDSAMGLTNRFYRLIVAP